MDDDRRNVWVFANHKGGVGKTTMLRMTAAVLAHRGNRVLVVDLDPNASVTNTLLPDDLAVSGDYLTTSDLLYAVAADPTKALGTAKRDDFPVASRWKGIDLIPAKMSLIDRANSNEAGRDTALRVGMHGIEADYDFILIDTPPYLGPLTYNALAAAHWALLVTQAELDSVNGLDHIIDAVTRTKVLLGNPDLQIAGTVVNMAETVRTTHSARLDEIQAKLDGTAAAFWPPVIHKRALIGDSVETRTPINEMGNSKQARAILEAVDAHVDRIVSATQTGRVPEFEVA